MAVVHLIYVYRKIKTSWLTCLLIAEIMSIRIVVDLAFAVAQDGGRTKGQMERPSVTRESHLPLLFPFIIYSTLVGMRVAAGS